MSVNTPTLITFVIYIAAMVLIGLAAYRSTNNFSDYILGGRSLGSFVTALSAGASDMSGWLLMGLYLSGLSESWIAIGLIVGAYLNWLFVAGRLRVQTEHNGNALTLPDYFTNRFEDNSRLLRIFSALVILVFFTIYCASGIVAGARLFEHLRPLLRDRAVGRRRGDHRLHLHRWLPRGELDRHRAGLADDLRADPHPGDRDARHRRRRADLHRHRAEGRDQLRHAQGRLLHRRDLADGLGPGLLRPAAHPGALHGRRLGEIDPGRAPSP